MTYQKVVLDVIAIANDLDNAVQNLSVVEDASYADAKNLHEALVNLGWVADKAVYSKCSAALYEVNLKKGFKKVNIVAANFLGSFVDVTLVFNV